MKRKWARLLAAFLCSVMVLTDSSIVSLASAAQPQEAMAEQEEPQSQEIYL